MFQAFPSIEHCADSDISPAAVCNPNEVDKYEHAYMYFGAVKAIISVHNFIL
jgi:hypothetical protein